MTKPPCAVPEHPRVGSRTLRLEIESDSAPIAGTLCADHGQWAFTGWLELGAALHDAILVTGSDQGRAR